MNNYKIYRLIFLPIFIFISFGCTRQAGTQWNGIPYQIHEDGSPQNQQEFWSLMNRIWIKNDFSDDWLHDSYRISFGTNYGGNPTPWDAEMRVVICSTKSYSISGSRQRALCLKQVISKYPTIEDAQIEFEEHTKRYPWSEETDFFFVNHKVDQLLVDCGEGLKLPQFDLLVPYNTCRYKMRQGTYFVFGDVTFPLDEEHVSKAEIGELLDILQERLIDPAADEIPDGIEPPSGLFDLP